MTARSAELALSASPDDIRQAAPWLASAGSDLGIPPSQLERLDRCFDEVLANVLAHGGPGVRHAPIVARLDATLDDAGGEATLEVSDSGNAFDPLKVTSKPTLGTLAQVDLGGLGLMLLRSNSDHLNYRWDGNRNHLAMTVRWRESGQ